MALFTSELVSLVRDAGRDHKAHLLIDDGDDTDLALCGEVPQADLRWTRLGPENIVEGRDLCVDCCEQFVRQQRDWWGPMR